MIRPLLEEFGPVVVWNRGYEFLGYPPTLITHVFDEFLTLEEFLRKDRDERRTRFDWHSH